MTRKEDKLRKLNVWPWHFPFTIFYTIWVYQYYHELLYKTCICTSVLQIHQTCIYYTNTIYIYIYQCNIIHIIHLNAKNKINTALLIHNVHLGFIQISQISPLLFVPSAGPAFFNFTKLASKTLKDEGPTSFLELDPCGHEQ